MLCNSYTDPYLLLFRATQLVIAEVWHDEVWKHGGRQVGEVVGGELLAVRVVVRPAQVGVRTDHLGRVVRSSSSEEKTAIPA